MAIVHGIVERHGGLIQAESKFGTGSTITFLLPLRGREVDNGKIEKFDLPRGDENILFVDDEAAITQSV